VDQHEEQSDMRVLVIEDSDRLRQSIEVALRESGYAVDSAASGDEGFWKADAGVYDVIVLDLMLPGLSGMELLARLRAKKHRAAVLILTARDTVDDRVKGLDAGADDYLVKPFSIDELLARVRALIRRANDVRESSMSFRDLQINTSARTVERAGKNLDLSPREYMLLEFFALHAGQCLSRSQIEAAIYDAEAEPMSNVVDAAVYALRKKIDQAGAASLIQTRRGMGYTFAGATEAREDQNEQ
jgi:DNA-binding response OmpR family regulator